MQFSRDSLEDEEGLTETSSDVVIIAGFIEVPVVDPATRICPAGEALRCVNS